jgi:hypothetical protein
MQLARRAAAIALVAAVGCLGSSARAQPQPSGSGSVSATASAYHDNDETVVVTAAVDSIVALPADTHVGAGVLVDVISSASVDILSSASMVDVVSSASARHEEVRFQWGAQAGVWATPELDLGVAFTHSTESDWDSYTPGATIGLDLAKRNTHLAGSYYYSFNDISKIGEPTFDATLQSHTADVGVSQLVGPKTMLGLGYTARLQTGLQSSPYRRVGIGATRWAAAETHPDFRWRNAVTAQILRYLGHGVAVDGSYRFYLDDWGIYSSTLAAMLRIELGALWDMRIAGRGYYQRAASFWRRHYDRPQDYVSVDRELSRFWDAGGGLGFGYHDGGWGFDTRVDVLYYRYLNFALLDDRVVLLLGLGGSYQW